MIEQQLQFMQSRVQPVSTEDLRTDDTSCPSRTLPTILFRKTFLTDHLAYEHFGAILLRPIDNLFEELYGAKDEDDWKSTTERILNVPWAPLCSLLVSTLDPSHRRFL